MTRNPFDIEIKPIRIPGLSEEETKGKRVKFSRTYEKTLYDKYKGRCAICRRETEFYDGDIDHIKPLAKGGTNSPSNLQWLCHRCNKLKGSKKTNAQVKKEILGLKSKSKRKGKKKTKGGRRRKTGMRIITDWKSL
ncbi:HNH endonuclease [Candidatus Micrarchaeota archaeon]|nr:HNH endonuclease [Candidatus Micrarchaeota archaeon]